jgi:acyl-coenzyme A synthetase/AMP-(fatty) acid ligase
VRLIPLTRLLAEGRPDPTPVATRGDAALDWATFAGQVDALRQHLTRTPPAGPPPHRWAVFTDDAYAFAVALSAIWQAGDVPVVLPSIQPGALRLLGPGIRGVVTDAACILPGTEAATVPALHPRSAAWTPVAIDDATAAAELFTSGTTGDRKTVVKTFGQLTAEVSGLERRWGAEVADRQVIGTVSHQHIYGMLFRVLWPLCAARVFRAEALLYPEEIVARLGSRPGYLVSAPAHLRRLAEMGGVAELAQVCRPVFSAGAPLDETTAARLAATFGAAPLEVFGSTETGGVAWRQQTADRASLAWTPFEDVRVRREPTGLLHVCSPRVSAPGSFTMADRADLADCRFLLRGRADRVVKIAGKRLSLPEMEEHLHRHSWVAEAALAVVEWRGEPRVAAAIVLTEKGRESLVAGGRRLVSTELTEYLAPLWDRVLLPRMYRYETRLPEDAQGKTTTATIARLFAASTDRGPCSPEILEDRADGPGWIRRLRVPGRTAFEGHFPQMVVVPGFVQLDWVMDLAEHLTGSAVTLTRVENLKFKNLLHPDQIIDLRARLSERADALTFQLLHQDGRVVSQGRCWLTDEIA